VRSTNLTNSKHSLKQTLTKNFKTLFKKKEREEKDAPRVRVFLLFFFFFLSVFFSSSRREKPEKEKFKKKKQCEPTRVLCVFVTLSLFCF